MMVKMPVAIYWGWPKSSFGFAVSFYSYGKTRTNFLANPIDVSVKGEVWIQYEIGNHEDVTDS